MRRVLSGFVPLAMAGAALFASAPPASAATGHAAASGCYGPNCKGQGVVSVTIQKNPNGGGTVDIAVDLSGFEPGEIVNIIVEYPAVEVGSFLVPGGTSAQSVDHSSAYNGGLAASIALPAGYPAGPHTIVATGTKSGVVATTGFTLSTPVGSVHPCTASVSSTHTSGVVLAAAFLTAQCKSAIPPAAAGGPPSSGSGLGNVAAPPASGNGAPAAIGTAAIPKAASQLPFTGFNAATVAASGAILVGAGGALVLATRRRRRSAWQ